MGSRGVIEFENTYLIVSYLKKETLPVVFRLPSIENIAQEINLQSYFVPMTLSEGLRAKNNALLPTPSTITRIGAREICIKRRHGFKSMLRNTTLI